MPENNLDIAIKYLKAGYSVFPLKPRSKQPAISSWKPYQERKPNEYEIRAWWKENPDYGIAIVTGAVSGDLLVLDCDPRHGGQESLEGAGLMPGCPIVQTGGGGQHYYFQGVSGCKTAILPGLDIKGEGGYVVAPPSIHPDTGKPYSFLEDFSIFDLPIAEPPAWLTELLKNGHKPTTTFKLPEAIPDGIRNHTIFKFASSLRAKGLSEAGILAALQVENARCNPPLDEKELEDLAHSGAKYPEGKPDSDYHLTDLGNAQRLVAKHGGDIRYCYERKSWLIWSGKVWQWDSGAKITALAKDTVTSIYHEAGNEPDENRRKAIADHAKRSESESRIAAMISLAESENRIPIRESDLDRNPYLLNCSNGTVNLLSGALEPHSKEDYLTIILPTSYEPEAEAHVWHKFLDRVTGKKDGLKSYLQRAVGYSLTAETKAQIVLFLYGLGSNGKSTFVNTIRKLLGLYAQMVATELFMIKDKAVGGPKEGLANLQGKRFVSASELEDGQKLATALVKDLSGGESLRADRKYAHEVEFQPTFKLWLSGNHKPVIKDTTLSIWRRLKLIPLTETIPENEIDPNLPEYLEQEFEGILAWAVEGCLLWGETGLQEPACIKSATADYRHEQDILGDFIQDCCELDSEATVTKTILKGVYEKWAAENSVEPVTTWTFKNKLVEKGVTDERTHQGRAWRGIGLKKVGE